MLFANVSPATVDSIIWLGLAGLILVAIVAGFVAGVSCAPILQERAIRRAARHVHRLFELTTTELDRASRLCNMLGQATKSPLDEGQWQRLDGARQHLAEAWKTIADRQATQHETEESAACATGPSPFRVEWTRTPVETATQLPDRGAFEGNLRQMLAAGAERCQPSGLLLVRVDKCDQLTRRYGAESVASLQAKLVTLVIKAARDEDLVCRLAPDLFAVLIPSVSPMAGARLAETIRSAVREHSFCLEESGPAVLVTASFGYAVCLPGDPPTLVLDRASEAISKSESVGRNQLHVHDAANRVLAKIG